MGSPTSSEIAAIAESGPLERFAAERIAALDPSLTLAIAQAHVDSQNEQWTPAASQSFWAAFNKLCIQIQPTTLDCLAASNEDLDSFNWLMRRKRKVSLAQKTSGRYLIGLLVTILLALPLQLYVWGGSLESKKIDETLDRLQRSVTGLTEDYQKLLQDAPPVNKDGSNPPWSGALITRADTVIQEAIDLERDLDRVTYQTAILQRLTTAQVRQIRSEPPYPKDPQWYDYYHHAANRYGSIRLVAVQAQEEAGLEVGVVLSFLLPLLFGVIGAIAYVVRSISNEISTTTFSRTSPTRHLMRVTLGALAGVVVGFFTNLTTQVALSWRRS